MLIKCNKCGKVFEPFECCGNLQITCDECIGGKE